MVKSNKGRSVHDAAQGYDDSPQVDDVGLASGGFDFNPEAVPGTRKVKYVNGSANDSESEKSTDYDDQNDVREWETQGEFGPNDEVFGVFSEVMDSPAEELQEDHEVATDGGVPNGSPFYRDEDQDTLYDEDQDTLYDEDQDTLYDEDHEVRTDGGRNHETM